MDERREEERRSAASLLSCWWAMVQAQEEIAERPIPRDAVILHFMGSGASCMVFARDLDAVCEMLAEDEMNQRAHRLVASLSESMTAIADLVKGPPEPDSAHSWHDLVETVRARMLTPEHRAVIEEAVQVLESGAAHNRKMSRTVLERTQQDRADRLRTVLADTEVKSGDA